MFSIVHSTWIKELHSRSVRKRSSMECDFLENVADPVDKGPETQLMLGQIISVVELLPEAQRVVMLLVAMEGLSYQEAADVLEVILVQIAGVAEISPINKVTLFIEQNRIPDGGRSGVIEA
jgi:DNA-directed RNA polymerase specialized sigma24 family protein